MNSKNTIQRIADSVAGMDLFRGDTQTGIFAQQLVRATFSELFRFEYPETKWMNGGLIPINTSINEGATEYSFTELGNVGEAEIVADSATDLPMADLEGRNNLREIKTVGIAVQYSRQDIRTARMNGTFDVASEKAAAAREGHDRALNRFIRSGVPGTSLVGVVDQPGIIVANAITGNWQTASAAQIVADMSAAINGMINASDGIEMPDTVVMDVATFTRISTLQNSTASDITVLDYLRRVFPMISRWDWEPGMRSVSAAGGPAIVIYRNDPMRMRAVFPMMMTAVPPEQRGLSFVLNFETRFGGVMTPRPRSVLRLDGV
jgi:hypothetical protein